MGADEDDGVFGAESKESCCPYCAGADVIYLEFGVGVNGRLSSIFI